MIKGILFDKDGTILEFHSTMHNIYTDIFKCLKDRYRVPDLLLQRLKDALGHLPDRLRSDSLLPFSTNPQIAEALLEASGKYAVELQWQQPFNQTDLLELIEEISLGENVPYTTLPGVPETLRYLKNKDYKIGIATADTLTATVAGLKKSGIIDYFEYLGTGDDSKPKPDTFLADMFCNQCGIAPNEILIIGDSKNDMVFAENVGAYFIGIDPPCNSTSVFSTTEHKSVSNINEIIEIFSL